MDYLKIQKKILEKIHKNPYRNIYVTEKERIVNLEEYEA